MITIVDYGIGNMGSVLNMLKKIGTQAIITSKEEDIGKADKLILPGVGAFDTGMQHLAESGLINVLNEKVLNQKIPVLGICLGMQLLTNKSGEGKRKGLGWLDAETKKFIFNGEQRNLKIPHMGWNYVLPVRHHKLVEELPKKSHFYFVHSYYVDCYDEKDVLLYCNYGIKFACAVQKENIMGVQFHPEKSHKFGIQVLKNFSEL